MVVSKKFLHFSKHHFPKDSESGLKSRKISSLSFLPDLNHPTVQDNSEQYLDLLAGSLRTLKIGNFKRISLLRMCWQILRIRVTKESKK